MYQALLHKCHAVRAGLCLVCLGNPLCEVRDPSPHEQIILREERDFHYYLNPRRQAALTAFYPGRSLEDCVRIFDYHSAGLRLVRRNGLLQPAPLQSPFYTVTGGRRRVTDVPVRWQRTLHLLGGAPAIGLFAPDGQTVASQIQRAFNAHAPESVRVLNPANGGSFLEAARQLLSPRYPLRPGDLLVLPLYECDSQALAETARAAPAARNSLLCLTAGVRMTTEKFSLMRVTWGQAATPCLPAIFFRIFSPAWRPPISPRPRSWKPSPHTSAICANATARLPAVWAASSSPRRCPKTARHV